MEIHAELLVGKQVCDTDGQPVGRIEELRGDARDNAVYITEFLVGAYGMVERLAAWHIARVIAGTVPGLLTSYAIPWDKIDLQDPEHPRLTCARDDLPQYEL